MARSIRVLIADDHEVVREGLKLLIAADPDIEVAGEAANGETAVQMALQLEPEVILMDLSMPGGGGLDAVRRLGQGRPKTRVLVLSAYQDEETVASVMESGAAGFITKHSAASELLAGIRQVCRGNTYFSPKVIALLKARERRAFVLGSARSSVRRLTPRESEVLLLIARGLGNKQIAGEMKLSVKTVEKHRQQVMDKLNIHDVAGLTRHAISKGLLAAVEKPATPSVVTTADQG